MENTEKKDNKGEIAIYQSKDGQTKIDVRFEDETVWLTQQQMAQLYQSSRTNIVEHIRHIYEEGELDESATCRNFRQVQIEGNRQVSREIPFYNLDMIISLGYRVKSMVATQFRRWATDLLKEYLKKGYALDDKRLKDLGGGDYWKELLDRIRDIRSSEKVMYRQVLDLYATSADYNPKNSESIAFFKMVQNKFHYAVHGNTAAEVIYNRADSEKEFMGLTTFDGDFPTKKDIKVAKNYLSEKELKVLNNLVSAYFDLAEINAMEHKTMYMADYVEQLDKILSGTGKDVLEGAICLSQNMSKSFPAAGIVAAKRFGDGEAGSERKKMGLGAPFFITQKPGAGKAGSRPEKSLEVCRIFCFPGVWIHFA